jgi:hypothetical protein
LRIGREDYLEAARFEAARFIPVARGLARDHDNNLGGREGRHQVESPTQ